MDGEATPLLLVGAGGLGREAVEVVRAVNEAASGPRWELVGLLDDRPELHGRDVDGVEVVGPLAAVEGHADAAVLLCTGSPRDPTSRHRLAERLGLPERRWATLVHPGAHVAASATLGPGCLLLAGVVVTAAATIGAHVVMMPGVVITHDDVVGDGATFAAGARLGGGVGVGDCAYLGSASSVREGCTVGARAVVGMGAVVLDDVPSGETWVGVPAGPLVSRASAPVSALGGGA